MNDCQLWLATNDSALHQYPDLCLKSSIRLINQAIAEKEQQIDNKLQPWAALCLCLKDSKLS